MVPLRAQRESNETPILNAFCRAAPSLRLSALAVFGAGVFDLAIVFTSLTSCVVRSRRVDVLFAMMPPLIKPDSKQLINAPAGLGMSTGFQSELRLRPL